MTRPDPVLDADAAAHGAAAVGAARVFALVMTAAALGGCQQCVPDRSTCATTTEPRPNDRPYFGNEASVEEQTAALVARLSSSDPKTFDETARRLAQLGERAVPSLVVALRAPDATTRAHAALLLGVLLDRRTIPDLESAATTDDDETVRCEAGRALIAMGDPRGFDPLIEGLASSDARRRARCIDTFFETTHRRLGFEADGSPEERDLAVRRWRAWRDRNRAGLAPPPTDADAGAGKDDAKDAAKGAQKGAEPDHDSRPLPNAPSPRR